MSARVTLKKAPSPLQIWLERFNNPRYFWLTRPLVAFLMTRLIVLLGAYIAEIAIPGMVSEGYYHVSPNNILLDVWARWDSAFYLSIVERGYFFEVGQQSSVAFFPLYPLLMSWVMPFVGSALAAGVLVSNACLLGALIFLYRLSELEFHDHAVAGRTVFYIAAFPTAFFFTAVYTESTFLLFSVATMYFARTRQWAWAAVFGILCSASRIVGFLMTGIVALEWMRAQGWSFGRIHHRETWLKLLKGLRHDWLSVLTIALIPLGMFSYMLFLKVQFNDPIAFSTTQSAWGRQMLGPITIIARDLAGLAGGDFLTGRIWFHLIFDLGAFFAVLAMTFSVGHTLGASYAVYCLMSVLIPASSGSQSLIRYALVIFPVFMLLGVWGKRVWLDRALLIFFSVFLGIFTAIFVNWIFIA